MSNPNVDDYLHPILAAADKTELDRLSRDPAFAYLYGAYLCNCEDQYSFFFNDSLDGSKMINLFRCAYVIASRRMVNIAVSEIYDQLRILNLAVRFENPYLEAIKNHNLNNVRTSLKEYCYSQKKLGHSMIDRDNLSLGPTKDQICDQFKTNCPVLYYTPTMLQDNKYSCAPLFQSILSYLNNDLERIPVILNAILYDYLFDINRDFDKVMPIPTSPALFDKAVHRLMDAESLTDLYVNTYYFFAYLYYCKLSLDKVKVWLESYNTLDLANSSFSIDTAIEFMSYPNSNSMDDTPFATESWSEMTDEMDRKIETIAAVSTDDQIKEEQIGDLDIYAILNHIYSTRRYKIDKYTNHLFLSRNSGEVDFETFFENDILICRYQNKYLISPVIDIVDDHMYKLIWVDVNGNIDISDGIEVKNITESIATESSDPLMAAVFVSKQILQYVFSLSGHKSKTFQVIQDDNNKWWIIKGYNGVTINRYPYSSERDATEALKRYMMERPDTYPMSKAAIEQTKNWSRRKVLPAQQQFKPREDPSYDSIAKGEKIWKTCTHADIYISANGQSVVARDKYTNRTLSTESNDTAGRNRLIEEFD